jgi:predicted metal-dependent HD superfamily phosphohydrolase
MRPASERLELSRWAALMGRLSLGDNLATFERLQGAYGERHRHYHTGEHINQCLDVLDQTRHRAHEPDEVGLALWFHDAIYATRAKDNEAKSAQWATEFLEENFIQPTRVRRVHALVMATTHDATAQDADAGLLIDIDLSILGADGAAYDRFERNVRKEYWWVPAPLFRTTRAKILQSFLDRPSIYSTAHFRDRLEQFARNNLVKAIAALNDAG